MNPYEVLELTAGASQEEIKAAYHGMAKKWHPDRYSGAAKEEAEQRFRMLAEAYNLLKDTPAREDGGHPSVPAPAAAAPIPLDVVPEKSANKTAEEWFAEAKAAMDARANEKALGLIRYAIRLNGERAEFHALHGKLLEATKGDRRTLVRALETAVRLNPRDVDSTVLLAETFQSLGMHARATRLWTVVRSLAPNHPIFSLAGKPKASEKPGLAEQFTLLVANAKDAIHRIIKRG